MDSTEKLFKELTEAAGVSGYEGEVRAIIRRHLEPVAHIKHDKLGSIIGVKRGSADAPRVMLVGHMDEVGFMVSLITDEGFIRFVPLGRVVEPGDAGAAGGDQDFQQATCRVCSEPSRRT